MRARPLIRGRRRGGIYPALSALLALAVLLGVVCGEARAQSTASDLRQSCKAARPLVESPPSGSLACPKSRPRSHEQWGGRTESSGAAHGVFASLSSAVEPILRPIIRLRSHSRIQLAAVALASIAVFALPPVAAGKTVGATPGTLDSVFDSASGGDTIELEPGDYGTFRGSLKPSRVTLKPEPGAEVRIALDFEPASNITIRGVTVTDAVLGDSRTRNITVRNSRFPGPGQVTFRTGELARANILFEDNVHRDFDPGGGGEGRVFLPERTSQPSGITIRGSEFRGGTGDGIQNGSNGTKIIGNEFHDLEPGQGPHTDAIQLYGSANTVIRRNYFHDLNGAPPIMAPDGADHELIEDNVVRGDRGGYPYAISLGSDNGSIVRHNTFADGACDYNLHCGIVAIAAKDGAPGSRGTVVKDNILGELSVKSSSLAGRSHNLIAHGPTTGTADIAGKPVYAGGKSPASFSGYALARRSRGRANASDGLDRGARIGLNPCKRAKAKVRTARKRLGRAKRKLRRAGGHRTKRKVKRAKRRLKQAKRKRRRSC